MAQKNDSPLRFTLSNGDLASSSSSSSSSAIDSRPPQPQPQPQQLNDQQIKHQHQQQHRNSIVNRTASLKGGKQQQVLLPWDKFSHWMNAILVVTFDIELGQSLESIYPSASHVKLTQNEKSNICYMSFPDSNSGFLGDIQYHFRIKQDPSMTGVSGSSNAPNVNINTTTAATTTPTTTNPATLGMPNGGMNTSALVNNMSSICLSGKKHLQTTTPLYTPNNNVSYDEYNRKTLSGLEVDKNHLFGYVYFRQVKDKTLKRGYFQKSVVLLSKFPFVSLFNYILSLIAVEYFNTGPEVLEAACHDVDKWPFPVPGEIISLPILGHLIEVCLPVKIDKYSLPVIYKKDLPTIPITLPPVHEVNLYKCLNPILIHIHLLWELILLNEPIVVIAAVPNICSETVQALISTIWPLKYASDYRPFFTIHNSEFQEYSSKSSAPPALVVGVTNPFFTKCLQHWPTIIKIADFNKQEKMSSFNHSNTLASQQQQQQQPQKQQQHSPKATKIKKTSNIKVVDTKPAVYTKHESYLSKDKELLKTLIKGAESNRPYEAQSALLRRYFNDLTQTFMNPLERYFSSLMPLHKTISPFKSVPKLKEFDADEFIKNLKQGTPELMPSLKGDWQGLYRRFLDSLNFKYWFQQKQQEAIRKLELLQIEVLCDYDVNKWLKGKQEIEIIDQYMNIKKKINLIESNQIEANEHTQLKLKSVLNTFLNALPEDVRSILNK